ncbi:MAG: alpha/beta hydrolase [Pirellulaceae bacterium]|nr:alpha/beta hydrolase [Pirellulaceae bacterium]
MKRLGLLVVVPFLFHGLVTTCAAQNPARPKAAPGRTLGGKQLWTDHLVFQGWRIQRYVITGHHRLLDEQNRRQAWGSFEHCRKEFDRLRGSLPIAKLKPRVVITLHGLGRSRQSMKGLGEFLKANDDVDVVNVSYASTRDGIAAHAKALKDVISGLDEVKQVDFVGHSLGNLVIRRYLHDQLQARSPHVGPRVGRIVMLAPPNGGAQMAERMQNIGLFHFLVGTSGSELAREWNLVQQTLATPKQEFGVIAGDVNKPQDGNPLIDGPDDLVVSVAETKLMGARDFLVVLAMHTFIMDQKPVREAVLMFLRNGYFVSEQKRRPI